MKKFLLITDMPPCRNFTGGLVLDRLVRFLPSDRVAICSIVNRRLKPDVPEDLEIIPELRLKKPHEAIPNIFPSLLGKLASFTFELIQALQVKYILLPKIVNFAKEQKIDALWVVLQGQTTVRLARQLSNKLALPLFTQIWDPFEWWLRANRVDGFTKQRLLGEFDEVIKHSTSCASASWTMSKNYVHRYGDVHTVPVIAGLPRDLAKSPANKPHSRDEFIIAMAGQFYAKDEWECLIDALNQVNWLIAGRSIRIRVMGGNFNIATHNPVNFEYLGWRSQEETISLLASSDLLYMPYWFCDEFALESKSCFPSKLVSYFASGRPVFCHAPHYSSPTRYIAKYDAGFLCASLDKKVVLQELERAISDTVTYAKCAQNGNECFLRDFTLEAMQKSFFEFLQLGESKEIKG